MTVDCWVILFGKIFPGSIWHSAEKCESLRPISDWVLLKGGLENRMEKRNGKWNGKLKKLCQYNIFFSCKYTLSVNFTLDGKVQQCLIIGSKWNIFVTDTLFLSSFKKKKFLYFIKQNCDISGK